MRTQLKKKIIIKYKEIPSVCGAVRRPCWGQGQAPRPVLEARSPLAMTRMEVGGNATRVAERKLKFWEPWQKACGISAHSAQHPAGIRSALAQAPAGQVTGDTLPLVTPLQWHRLLKPGPSGGRPRGGRWSRNERVGWGVGWGV